MTSTPPTTPERRKRRQAMSDDGRLILQRERQRLAREQAVLGERLANEARRNAARHDYVKRAVKPEDAAVQRGIVKRIATVLASEDVNVRMNVTTGTTMSAWTDFESIHVRYRHLDNIKLLAAVIRGLCYHEGGHCRFSISFPDLRDMVPVGTFPYPTDDNGNINWMRLQKSWNALEDQRMETAVTSDAPVKASYLTPMMMTELLETPDRAIGNWPLLIWRRYLPRKLRVAARKGFVKRHGEALALDFEEVVDSYVRATDAVTMMSAVVENADLLDRAGINLKDDDTHRRHRTKRSRDENGNPVTPEIPDIPIAPEYEDEDEDDEPGDFPMPTDEGDDESTDEGGEDEDEDEDGTPTPSDDASDEEDDDEGEAEGDEGDNEDDEVEGDSDVPGGSNDTPAPVVEDENETTIHQDGGDHSDKADDAEDGDADGGDAQDEDELTQEDLDEAKAEAEAERDSDSALDDDVEAYHDAMQDRTSDLAPYVGGLSADTEATWDAEALASEIERSFQEATMDRQPAWVEGQHRGVINVARYEVARQSPDSDDDFYRAYVEDDQPGFNLAVSILLDYSSSMSAYTKELAQVGYASKLACQRLGIPCTVTLWDTEATVLYDATEQAEGLPMVNTAGATDPSYALADLENQRFDKDRHLVLIMTDGDWQGEWGNRQGSWGGGPVRKEADRATLAYHNTDGTVMIGFGYSTYQGSADLYRDNLLGYGCPEAFGITDLMEIPERLREAMITLA
jgi:hypothetical protein